MLVAYNYFGHELRLESSEGNSCPYIHWLVIPDLILWKFRYIEIFKSSMADLRRSQMMNSGGGGGGGSYGGGGMGGGGPMRSQRNMGGARATPYGRGGINSSY